MVSLHWSSRSKMPVFERQEKKERREQNGENRKEREKTIGNVSKNLHILKPRIISNLTSLTSNINKKLKIKLSTVIGS